MSEAGLKDATVSADHRPRLRDLAEDFISMTLLVRDGRQATSVAQFETCVERFFADFEQAARSARYSAGEVKDCQYALCAFFDESILRAEGQLRGHFELQPLQFRYFGVHLAGQGFFDKLEALRADLPANLEVLEVYHLCLALGFEGKFALGQQDQLRYLASSLGQDIAGYCQAEQRSPGWALPDQVSQVLRYEVPLWLYLGLIAVLCSSVYLILDALLEQDLAALSEQIHQLFGA